MRIPDPDPAAARAPAATCALLTVWPADGADGFHARVMLDDGSAHAFDSPFELVRFLSTPRRRSGGETPEDGASRTPRGLR